MTVAELIAILSGLNPDSMVHIQIQPEYPMLHGVHGVAAAPVEMMDDAPHDCEMEPDEVYLLAGSWEGYGYRELWDQTLRPKMGWTSMRWP